MRDFNKYYSKGFSKYGASKRREEALLDLLGSNLKGLNILDVGCAGGEFGRLLVKRKANVTGIDVAKSAVKEAKKKLTCTKLVDLNDGRIPFRNMSFDIIVASEVIEHLFEPENSLKEFNRTLKNDGFLIVTTPNLLYWGNRLQFLKGKFKYEDVGVFDKGHIHFYTYETLKQDLAKAGFKITAECHIYLGNSIWKVLKDKMPGVFAYQLVIKCQKVI